MVGSSLAVVLGTAPLIAMMLWGVHELGDLRTEQIQGHDLFAQALRSYMEEDTDAAIRTCREALAVDEASAETHTLLGMALVRKQDPTTALTHFLRALEIDPQYSKAHQNVGMLLQSQSQNDRAIHHYREALKAGDWNNHEVLNNLAMLVQGDEAIGLYEMAIRISPEFFYGHFNLANALIRKGQVDRALVHFREAARIQPRSEEAQRALGASLSRSGQVREALPHLRNALQLNPDRVDALLPLSWALATHPDHQVRKTAEAITHAEHAIQLVGPNNPRAQDVLAAAYASAGRFDEAVRAAQRAVELTQRAGATPLAAMIQQRLSLYEQGQSYRAPGARPVGQ